MGKAPLPSEFQGLPTVGSEKMREVDMKATMDYGIPAERLMENAGKAIAEEILHICVPFLVPSSSLLVPVICCGRGNNGGDGLVTARYLKEAGVNSEVFIIKKEFGDLVTLNLKRAEEKGIKVKFIDNDLAPLEKALSACSIAVDCLLGTGFAGKPEGVLKKVIQSVNKSLKPIIAVDVPSGINPDTGHHTGVYIIAKWTLTLGLAKKGLLAPHAQPNVGELKVLDIGFPKELVDQCRLD